MRISRHWRTIGVWAAVLLTVIVGGVLLVEGSRWRTVTSAEGRFSVELPGRPGIQHQDAATPLGTLTVYAYSVVQIFHRSTYAASYCRYPAGILQQMEGDLVDTALNAAAGKTGGKVVAEKPLTGSGYAGKEQTLDAPGMGRIRLRVMVADDRVYTLIVYPINGKQGDIHADRFFASFRLR